MSENFSLYCLNATIPEQQLIYIMLLCPGDKLQVGTVEVQLADPSMRSLLTATHKCQVCWAPCLLYLISRHLHVPPDTQYNNLGNMNYTKIMFLHMKIQN